MKIERLKQILKKKYYIEFQKFMEGQTIGINENGEVEIYDDDFIRWFYKLGVID